MLNFDFFNQRAEVKRALSSRLNHNCMDGLRYQDRQAERSNFSQVVWLIPVNGKSPEYGNAVPVVSKDLSIQGLSLIHNCRVGDSHVVIAVPGEHGVNFFHCSVEHCSELGYGFFQIGLFPTRVIKPNLSDSKTWEERVEEFAMETAEAGAN